MTDGVTARDRGSRRGKKERWGWGLGGKKIAVVTIEIDSLSQSQLSSFPLSNLLTLSCLSVAV